MSITICECGNFRPTPTYTKDQCPKCWRNQYSPEEHRKLYFAKPGRQPTVQPLKVLPCVHVGKPVPPPDGKDCRRRYYMCDAGYGVVCACQCSPAKCDKYAADSAELPSTVGRPNL